MAKEIPYISIENVSFRYEPDVPLLDNLNASFDADSAILLAGPVGSGKSTFLKLLTGLVNPEKGAIRICGRQPSQATLADRGHDLGIALQRPEDQIFAATVQEEVAFGPRNLGLEAYNQIVDETLSLFSLDQFSGKHPYDLPPAMRKLLSLASAVALGTPFVIFDEPTSGLSLPEKKIVGRVLEKLRSQKKGYMIMGHDLSFGFVYCEHFLLLNKGSFVIDEPVDSFLSRPDAIGALKRAGLHMPAAVRMSKMLGHHPVERTAEELAEKMMREG